jgi:hypothetical protein
MKKCRCIIFPSWHRVDRALSFFSSRPNWDYPTPSHAGDVYPFLVPGGGEGLRERGWVSPNSDVGKTLGVLQAYMYIVNHGEGKSFLN